MDVIATFEAGEFSAVQRIDRRPPSSTLPPGGTHGVDCLDHDLATTPMGLGMVLAPAEIARIKALTGFDLTPTVSKVSITILQQVDVLGHRYPAAA